ncbi:hypothetical protein PS1_009954 [Malus domestica]
MYNFCSTGTIVHLKLGFHELILDKGGTTIQMLLNSKSIGKVEAILVHENASAQLFDALQPLGGFYNDAIVFVRFQFTYHKGIRDKGGTIFFSEFNSTDFLAICELGFVLNVKKRIFLEEADPLIVLVETTFLAFNLFDKMWLSSCCMCYWKGIQVSLPVVGLFLVWWWTGLARVKADYIMYRDLTQPAAARVGDLLSRMTLEEKIGQMVQINRSVASIDTMKTYFIGNVLSGGGSAPLPETGAEDWVNMINGFQKGALSSRLDIPMIYGIDVVHGHNNVYNATIFPHNVGLGATRDLELVRRIGSATALEARATGIPYVFAPCIAICRDPRRGRCYESYSEDYKLCKK